MALGVPDVTVRAALVILIVLGALLALIAAIGDDLGLSVPEALAGIFGTILGFYFGRPGSVETVGISGSCPLLPSCARSVTDSRSLVRATSTNASNSSVSTTANYSRTYLRNGQRKRKDIAPLSAQVGAELVEKLVSWNADANSVEKNFFWNHVFDVITYRLLPTVGASDGNRFFRWGLTAHFRWVDCR